MKKNTIVFGLGIVTAISFSATAFASSKGGNNFVGQCVEKQPGLGVELLYKPDSAPVRIDLRLQKNKEGKLVLFGEAKKGGNEIVPVKSNHIIGGMPIWSGELATNKDDDSLFENEDGTHIVLKKAPSVKNFDSGILMKDPLDPTEEFDGEFTVVNEHPTSLDPRKLRMSCRIIPSQLAQVQSEPLKDFLGKPKKFANEKNSDEPLFKNLNKLPQIEGGINHVQNKHPGKQNAF